MDKAHRDGVNVRVAFASGAKRNLYSVQENPLVLEKNKVTDLQTTRRLLGGLISRFVYGLVKRAFRPMIFGFKRYMAK